MTAFVSTRTGGLCQYTRIGGRRAYHRDMHPSQLEAEFGHIDIYLFDQLLRGRIRPGMTILDAGCGAGRNLIYFLRHSANDGYRVYGVDSDPKAIAAVRRLAASASPLLDSQHFQAEPVESISLPDGFADFVISSAVLHFAAEDAHFAAMLESCWRVLKPGGIFFSRLASSIGIEDQVRVIQGRRCHLPDGSERYLVDEPLLYQWTARLGGELIDPLKTTVMRSQRSMTTWVMQKPRRAE